MGVNGNKPLPVEEFGGLDLRNDASQVSWGKALVATNVDLDVPGMVRSRDGLSRIGAANALTASSVGVTTARYGTTDYVLSVCSSGGGPFLDRITMSGTVTSPGSLGASAFDMVHFANIGTASATYTYIATGAIGGAGLTLKKYDGASITSGAGKPLHVAVWPTSNRLVQGNYNAAADSPSGADGSPSTVFFSDADAPDTYNANSFVPLHPGDGEAIINMVAWRDFLFVLKASRLFVFYGESVGPTGLAEFNFRTISLPSPVTQTEGQDYMVAGQNGVYLSCADGVYLTTGGQPAKVSNGLDGAFDALAGITQMYGISYAWGRVLLAADLNGAYYVLDEQTGEWVRWVFTAAPTTGLVQWPGSQPYLRSAIFAGGRSLYRTAPGVATDAGSDFSTDYESGWNAVAPGSEATIRETELTGTGTPKFAWARDFGSFDAGVTVTLGTSPAVARGYHRVAKAGENLAYKLSSSSGAWSVRRVVPFVREVRGAGEKTT